VNHLKSLVLSLVLLAGCVRPHPVTPTPTPAPVPVTPAPVVVDNSVVAPTGFRALIIYETEAANTREQLAVIYSPVVTDYLNQHCVKNAAGRPEWRRWDKDVQVLATESTDMRDLWEAVKPKLGELPQLVLAKDGKAKVYPLPLPEPAAMTLIQSIAEGK
jgi:hypothetical protein